MWGKPSSPAFFSRSWDPTDAEGMGDAHCLTSPVGGPQRHSQ